MSRPHIVVLGLMGAGKSTVASQLAVRLGRPWRDSDTDIEARTGRTGREIAADPSAGVAALHTLEAAVLLDALASHTPSVVSAAAWVVDSDECVAAMTQRAVVVWLRAPIEVLRQRMATGNHRRFAAPGELEALVERRTPLFERVADVILDATSDPAWLVEQVVEFDARQRPPS